ncbi:MAG TPA: 7-carboxy-7-deazaguanine synthase QueE [Polyangiaceae bacterium]|jgi:7-carboxy-7-deazaguanine synthase|nr:7-carboxy-7-deazaguanine synthase QueE [Polyangiaceae bacterium]
MPSDGATLKLSEIFESLQGEGVSTGSPTVFVRLAQCNLHCTWCDTKYTWDFERYSYDDEVREQSAEDVARAVNASATRRLVLTGGEPLLQQKALAAFFASLARDIVVEVETNGTINPTPETLARVNQWNVSPKLSNAGDPKPLRLRPAVLLGLRDAGQSYLKLVVQSDADYAEADALVEELSWPRDRVLFMPEATDRDVLRARSLPVAEAARARGFRFSSRLHLELWGGRRGT